MCMYYVESRVSHVHTAHVHTCVQCTCMYMYNHVGQPTHWNEKWLGCLMWVNVCTCVCCVDSVAWEEEATTAMEQYTDWYEEERWGLCSNASSCQVKYMYSVYLYTNIMPHLYIYMHVHVHICSLELRYHYIYYTCSSVVKSVTNTEKVLGLNSNLVPFLKYLYTSACTPISMTQ